jgi:hypothetical protein
MVARTTAQRPSVLMRALSGYAGQQATPQGTRSLTAANADEYASNAREPAAFFLSNSYMRGCRRHAGVGAPKPIRGADPVRGSHRWVCKRWPAMREQRSRLKPLLQGYAEVRCHPL